MDSHLAEIERQIAEAEAKRDAAEKEIQELKEAAEMEISAAQDAARNEAWKKCALRTIQSFGPNIIVPSTASEWRYCIDEARKLRNTHPPTQLLVAVHMTSDMEEMLLAEQDVLVEIFRRVAQTTPKSQFKVKDKEPLIDADDEATLAQAIEERQKLRAQWAGASPSERIRIDAKFDELHQAVLGLKAKATDRYIAQTNAIFGKWEYT